MNILKKIQNFLNDSENNTLIIQFDNLVATLLDNGRNTNLTKDLPTYSVYITKGNFFGTLTFWFIDGAKIIFCLVTATDDFLSINDETKIEIDNFIDYEPAPVKGKSIIINKDSIIIGAYVVGNRNIINFKYLMHSYYYPKNFILVKETVDVAQKATQNSKNPNCYIATLLYGDINHPKVELIRKFRDNKLNKTIIGKVFIIIYQSCPK